MSNATIEQIEAVAAKQWREYERMMTTERDHTPSLANRDDLVHYGAWAMGPTIREHQDGIIDAEAMDDEWFDFEDHMNSLNVTFDGATRDEIESASTY